MCMLGPWNKGPLRKHQLKPEMGHGGGSERQSAVWDRGQGILLSAPDVQELGGSCGVDSPVCVQTFRTGGVIVQSLTGARSQPWTVSREAIANISWVGK